MTHLKSGRQGFSKQHLPSLPQMLFEPDSRSLSVEPKRAKKGSGTICQQDLYANLPFLFLPIKMDRVHSSFQPLKILDEWRQLPFSLAGPPIPPWLLPFL